MKRHTVYLNGRPVFEEKDAPGLKSFAARAYKHFGLKYPKFHKMDEISRLGFLAADILLHDDTGRPDSNTGIVLSNASSTLITDTMFQESIRSDAHFYPSPSVFVYTLPNIMIGEISIRHKLRGENAFFIFDRFNGEFITDYINRLFLKGKMNNCLGGWVEQSENNYEAFMYLAAAGDDMEALAPHRPDRVIDLYERI